MRKGDKIRAPRSDEHRRKLSLTMMGNQNHTGIYSDESKRKISEAMKGNTRTKGYIHDVTMDGEKWVKV